VETLIGVPLQDVSAGALLNCRDIVWHCAENRKVDVLNNSAG
jgi:hypothetical protein